MDERRKNLIYGHLWSTISVDTLYLSKGRNDADGIKENAGGSKKGI